jgi:hypothetical protein
VGAAHGTVVNAQLSGTGSLRLAGRNEYANLPNGILSSLTDVTLETWVTWDSSSIWQRIFDFGSTLEGTEGSQGTGQTYLFLTPRAGNSPAGLRVAYSLTGMDQETVVNGSSPLELGVMTQIAVVFDHTGGTLSLYRNGVGEGSGSIAGALGSLDDINNWLGRSQFSADPEFEGSLHEFRIYRAALDPCLLGLSYRLGPDAAW